MKNLDSVVGDIVQRLEAKDRVREAALRSARTLTRLSTDAVRAVHKREDAKRLLGEARREAQGLVSTVKEHADLYHAGSVEGAMAEYAEAACLLAVTEGQPLPTPDQLMVTDAAWLLGLGDVVGELRRMALDAVRAGDLAKADASLAHMERIFDALLRIDVPAALVPIRHKVDVARSLIEKTRGEVAVLAAGKELTAKLDALRGSIGRGPAPAPKKGDIDLDIDAVWKP